MKRLGHLQSSIKEAVDNLPSGVCFFDKNGFVVLCNRTMYRLAFAITGRDLQTFSELENALRNLPEGAWRIAMVTHSFCRMAPPALFFRSHHR